MGTKEMKLKTDENKYILILYDEIGQPSVKLPSLTKLIYRNIRKMVHIITLTQTGELAGYATILCYIIHDSIVRIIIPKTYLVVFCFFKELSKVETLNQISIALIQHFI